MRRYIEAVRRNDAVGRYLFWIWLANAAIVSLVLVVIGNYVFQQVDLAFNQADYEVNRQIKDIRDQLEQAIKQQPGTPLGQVISQTDWLDEKIRNALSTNLFLEYISLTTSGGQIYTWNKCEQNRSGITFRMGDAPHYERNGNPASHAQLNKVDSDCEQTAQEDLLHRSFYIHSERKHVGRLQIGVSAEHLDDQLERSHLPITISLILIGSVFLIALSVGTFLMWRMVDRTRAMDRSNERQTYIANFGRLARKMVHEIRNPLNTIRMQTAVIRNKIRDPKQENLDVAERQLASLDQEIVRLDTMTRSFLDLGQPPADRLENINLREFISELVEFIRPEFEQIDTEIVFQSEDGQKLEVKMDRSQLRGVILNLTKNAREALDNGGRLTFRLRRESRTHARVEVEDTGCGIAPEDLPNVFQAQYSHKKSGSGLGLALAAQIVDNVGGSINVESEVNKGTRFIITLPLTASAVKSR